LQTLKAKLLVTHTKDTSCLSSGSSVVVVVVVVIRWSGVGRNISSKLVDRRSS